MMKLVSVIIPTYNRAAYLPQALDSVLNQTLPKDFELEVIVVDDGSTDDTAKVLKKYGKKIIYKQIPHSGKPATARNAGIALAKGELIAFQDSDDEWAPNKLKLQLPLFNDDNVVLSFGNAEAMDENGKKFHKQLFSKSSLAQAEKFASLIKQNTISTLTVMVRSAVLQQVGGFNESKQLRAVEDYELWLRIAAHYPRGLRSINDTLAYYRTHGQNISSTDDLTAIVRLLNVYRSVWETNLSDTQNEQLEEQQRVMEENWGRLKNELEPDTKPAISVVMSVYNGAEHLRPALEGIFNQTYSNFEFIIIDDGSTDDSVKIIKSYKDPRVRIIRQRNHGLVFSLNKGLTLARGQFIARQDADDISLPTRFEKELALISSDPKIGVVGTYFTYIDEITAEPGISITGPTKSIDVKRTMYFNNPFGHGTTMIRKAVFGNVKPYTNDFGPTEDMELWQRIGDKWEFGIVPESLYWYRINPNSISHQKSEIQHKFTAQLIARQWAKPFIFKSAKNIIADGHYYRNMASPFAAEVYNEYVARQIDMAKALLRRGTFKTGLRTAYGAIRLKPRCTGMFIKPVLIGIIKRMGIRK